VGVLVFVSELFSSVGETSISVRVLAGVMVLLGVNVGVAEISGVAVGVEEAVLVGMVDVGKGPRSACMVPAMAVLILSTCSAPFPRPNTPLLLKMEPNPMKTNPMHRIICSRTCNGTLFCLFTLAAFLCYVFCGAGWNGFQFFEREDRKGNSVEFPQKS
jgi:hypothetical protein